MNIILKKVALALSFVLGITCLAPAQVADDASESVAKVAKSSAKAEVDFYTTIAYEKPKVGAKYSYSSFNNSVCEFVRDGYDMYDGITDSVYKKGAIVGVFATRKVGKATLRIKETYKKKTRLVAEKKINVEARKYNGNSGTYIYDVVKSKRDVTQTDADGNSTTTKEDYLLVEKGVSAPLDNFVGYNGTPNLQSANSNIVAIDNKKKTLTAKAVGETKIVFTSLGTTVELPVVVIASSDDADYNAIKETSKKIDSYYNKKVTVKNAIKINNELVALSKKYYDSYYKLMSKEVKPLYKLSKIEYGKITEKIANAVKKKVYRKTEFGVSLEGVKIKKANYKTMDITMKKPVTIYDVLCSDAGSVKITKKSQFRMVVNTSKCSYFAYVKIGAKKAKLANSAYQFMDKSKIKTENAYYTVLGKNKVSELKSIKIKK